MTRLNNKLDNVSKRLLSDDLTDAQRSSLTTQQATLTTQQATLTTREGQLLHEKARLEAEAKEERHRAEAKEAASLAPPSG